jgi:hypothetical protein
MIINDKQISALPIMALKEIPTPGINAQNIVALVKDSGKVTGYKLSDGSIVDKQRGVALAKEGGIYGVGVASRNGTEYLKSIPDGTEANNLSNLPSVSMKY